MIPIQELGLQILQNNPKGLYILGGPEYGIKDRYISHLEKLYGNHVEASSFDAILQQMNQKHIVPLEPTLYVIRYDDKFVSDINDSYASKILKSKIVGTVICIYENDKHISKFDKYLPDNTSVIETVNSKFVKKYLHEDFPKLDDRSINIAVNSSTSYGHARTICKSMTYADLEKLASTTEDKIASMFGCNDSSNEAQIQEGVASKNFKYLTDRISCYDGDLDKLLYTILQTMIELDKIQSSKYSDSPLKQYIKMWTREDIYYMFMNTYDQLTKLRSMSSYDVTDSLIYLFGLLKFPRIPSPEVMAS